MSQDKKYFYLFLIIGVILFILRLPTLLELPGIDQTLYAYISGKMREGQLLYRDVWDHKPPGIFFLYTTLSSLGSISPWVIPLVDLLFTLLTLWAIFLLAKKFWGSKSALGTAFFFALFSISPAFQGSWSRTQTEGLMNLLLILSFYGAYQAYHQQKIWPWFFSGLALGMAFVCKFTALILSLPLIPLLWAPVNGVAINKGLRINRFLFLFIGGIIPLAATIFYLSFKGILPEAYQAVVVFNGVYAGWREESKSIPFVLFNWYKGQLLLISVIFILTFLVFWRKRIYRLMKGQILILWIIGGVISIFLQGKYLEPHFISLIPPLSLLAGYSWEWIEIKTMDKKSAVFSLLVIALLATASGDVFRDYFHAYKPTSALRSEKFDYGQTLRTLPVNADKLELLDIGKFIAQNTEEKDYIYIWATATEIYYYSGRSAPNRFISHYYLLDAEHSFTMKFPGVKARRQELLNNLKTRPVKIILVGLKDLSPLGNGVPLKQLIAFEELHQWVQNNYTLIAQSESYLILLKKERNG